MRCHLKFQIRRESAILTTTCWTALHRQRRHLTVSSDRQLTVVDDDFGPKKSRVRHFFPSKLRILEHHQFLWREPKDSLSPVKQHVS